MQLFICSEDGWAWAGAGLAEDWLRGCPQLLPMSPKGSAFPDDGGSHPLPEIQPPSPESHSQLPVPYHPGPLRPTIDQQHVVQGHQLPIGRSSPFFPAIGLGPAAAPPSAALRWYSPPRLRRGGKVHCAAAWGVGKSRRGGGIPLECYRGVHPTWQGEARIGRELWAAAPDWSSAGTRPARWPRLRERPGPEFAEGRVGRAQGGGGGAGEFPPRARL